MLLHFPFDNHLNDVTCNKAYSSTYGQGTVTLVQDATRGTVASFNNGYLEVSTIDQINVCCLVK